MLEEFDLDQIQDLEGARQAIVLLLNLVENIKLENQELREQVQRFWSSFTTRGCISRLVNFPTF